VNTSLNHFDFIVPCGITDKGVTSLQRLLGRHMAMPEVETVAENSFREVFS
jgi:lipoyl(octanoyl) transferase